MSNSNETVEVQYKTAEGRWICVEVSPQVAELLEQTDLHIQAQRRQDRRYLDFVGSVDGLTDSTMRTPQQTDAADLVIQAESHARLHEALDMLSDVQRRRVTMRYFHDMKYCQIADVEDVDFRTIWTTIQRSLKKLRILIQN